MEQPPQLSQREWEVVRQLQQGMSNKQIAAALHISERTVEFHLNNIYNKLQVSSRVELVLKLGESTVAGGGESAENGVTSRLRRWAAALRDDISKIGQEQRMTTLSDTNPAGEARALKFHEAVLACLRKYAEFNGRAGRPEFWWFALFVLLAATALTYLSEVLGEVFLIGMLLPFLAAGARRLRDTGRSAWWLLFLLVVPVGGIVMLGFLWAAPPVGEGSPV